MSVCEPESPTYNSKLVDKIDNQFLTRNEKHIDDFFNRLISYATVSPDGNQNPGENNHLLLDRNNRRLSDSI